MRKTLLSLLAVGCVVGLGAVSTPANAQPWNQTGEYGRTPTFVQWHEREWHEHEWRRAQWERHRHWEAMHHWREWHHEGERW